jgi:thiamine-phosphate pyrophosphorylase
MKLVVISPEGEDAREAAVLADLFAAGLERYHVRKPTWPAEKLQAWIGRLPDEWRSRLILHSQHQLVDELGLGGRHWRDMPGNAGGSTAPFMMERPAARGRFTSRSCHDIPTLRAVFDRYDSIFFGPIFPTMSKPGYGPSGSYSPQELSDALNQRSTDQRRAVVLALGGITPETAPRAIALGFDGVAVLGAIWHAPEPARAYEAIRESIQRAPKTDTAPRTNLSSDAA